MKVLNFIRNQKESVLTLGFVVLIVLVLCTLGACGVMDVTQ